MAAAKYFAYLMIIAGLCLEFLAFQLCSRAECYFLMECGGKVSAECLAAFFASSLLLIVGGAYLLKRQMAPRYI